jgi:hypothetical protein
MLIHKEIYPETSHKDPEYGSTHYLTFAIDGVVSKRHALAALTPDSANNS